MSHLQWSAGWSGSFPPHQKVPALRRGPAWAAQRPPYLASREQRQPCLTVFCANSVQQWTKGTSHRGSWGSESPPQCPPPSERSGTERYTCLWRSSCVLLATSPSPLILGEVIEVASSSGPPRPPSTLGKLEGPLGPLFLMGKE